MESSLKIVNLRTAHALFGGAPAMNMDRALTVLRLYQNILVCECMYFYISKLNLALFLGNFFLLIVLPIGLVLITDRAFYR